MALEMNRRNFVIGAAGAAAMAIAPIALADEAPEGLAAKVTETVDADFVVVGSGAAGMAAGLQAAELGLKVVILEATGIRGALRMGAEGICAANSPMQKELGIEINIADAVDRMASINEYKINALFWKNMLTRSGDNIQWLIDKGVDFSGQVDDYMGDGLWPMFHWFNGTFALPSAMCDPLEVAFNGYEGCEIRLNTTAKELKFVDGKVAGVYALTEGGVLEVNAKVVVLATGGFSQNVDMVHEVYPNLYEGRYFPVLSALSCNGDGKKMALSAGARNETNFATFMTVGRCMINTNDGSLQSLGLLADGIWVNQDGVRFTREDIEDVIGWGGSVHPILNNQKTFVVADASILDNAADYPEAVDILEKEAAENAAYVIEAETIEELAQKMGVPVEAFVQTIASYNDVCAAGQDTEFNKDPKYLHEIGKAPFFGLVQGFSPYKLLGCTPVNVNYQVVDANDNAIDNLYAVGSESNMNYYKAFYSYDCPGGCCAQCVDSGRVAAKHAFQKYFA